MSSESMSSEKDEVFTTAPLQRLCRMKRAPDQTNSTGRWGLYKHRDSNDSALKRHSLETGHHIDLETPSVLASDGISECLLVKESLKIKN